MLMLSMALVVNTLVQMYTCRLIIYLFHFLYTKFSVCFLFIFQRMCSLSLRMSHIFVHTTHLEGEPELVCCNHVAVSMSLLYNFCDYFRHTGWLLQRYW